MTEADDLRQAVREFLQATSPPERVRELMDTDDGYDRAVWKQMAGQLGLHGIAIGEHFGGAGATMSELAVVFEEMGAALLCAPFFSTVALAAHALQFSGDSEAMERYLPTLVDGSTTATVILNGRLDPWDESALTLTVRRDSTDHRINGTARYVVDGHTANLILAAANTGLGPSLFAVSGDSEGLAREPLATLDRTRKVARLQFDDVPAQLIGTEGDAATGLARTSNIALVALAAEQTGAARRCLDMAVGYARERIQFGRAIGSFQAVKHRCADMLVAVEGAKSTVSHAAKIGDDLPVAASVAKMVCSDALLQVALDNMRIHGGIGFTWEHDAHLYVRRAKATALIFGTPDYHAQRLATLVTSSQR
ncbi:acyl-CoA dehydrogenase family protein [Mycobacterium sp. 1274761.0]|uniref:acyl-CoA dehydrogenase family protein n=1 Tax=Mycobacterium sp. 1274761.0 TaxID=1834077 RepID=UPI000B2F79D2|nr:acyl-CoA dehydrogenase family protein [Mycobacterium sp. 1274761.0]